MIHPPLLISYSLTTVGIHDVRVTCAKNLFELSMDFFPYYIVEKAPFIIQMVREIIFRSCSACCIRRAGFFIFEWPVRTERLCIVGISPV